MKPQRTKIKKYFKEREIKGNKQDDALETAGYNPKDNHGTRVENSETYKDLKEKYSDVLLNKTSYDELADLQIRNAKQTKDKGASNKATESILNRVAPLDTEEIEADNVVIKISRE